MRIPRRFHIAADTFRNGRKLPKGWSWGKFWCNHREFGWWAIRESDGFVIKVVDDPNDSLSVAKAIRSAIAEGLIPKDGDEDRR